jgi:hypothetical protein
MTEPKEQTSNRGGLIGKEDLPPKGERSEKGDKRRDGHNHHSGPTRPGGSGRGKPGSESNAESDDK